jgi:hypothetical protein
MNTSRQPNFFQPRSLAWALTLVCTGIAGCASYGPQGLSPGATQAVVAAQMGPPTERQKLDNGGERLVYARGPMGQHTWMVDFAADGRLTGWFQALEPRRLASIQPGMTAVELRKQFGPPAAQRGLAIDGRSLMAWRYPTYDCLWFAVTLDAGGRVLDAGSMPDPRCDVDHD